MYIYIYISPLKKPEAEKIQAIINLLEKGTMSETRVEHKYRT